MGRLWFHALGQYDLVKVKKYDKEFLKQLALENKSVTEFDKEHKKRTNRIRFGIDHCDSVYHARYGISAKRYKNEPEIKQKRAYKTVLSS